MPQNQQTVNNLVAACDALKAQSDACAQQFGASGSIDQTNLDLLNQKIQDAVKRHSQLVS
jgi:hypothetical protein